MKQGQFKGQSVGSKRPSKWIEVSTFDFSTQVPLNSGTGTPKGPRKGKPIVITKEMGVVSPLLLNAHWTEEVLTEVVFEIVGRPTSGQGEVVVQRITLTNAQIASARPITNDRPGGQGSAGRSGNEFVLTYEDITWDIGRPGTIAT